MCSYAKELCINLTALCDVQYTHAIETVKDQADFEQLRPIEVCRIFKKFDQLQ